MELLLASNSNETLRNRQNIYIRLYFSDLTYRRFYCSNEYLWWKGGGVWGGLAI